MRRKQHTTKIKEQHTFERNLPCFNELRQQEIRPKSTRTNGVEIQKRSSDLGRHIGGESEDSISNQASHGGFRRQQHLPEYRDSGSIHGFEKVPNLIPGPEIVLGQAVRNCPEAEVRIVPEANGGIGVGDEALVDVVCVEECDFDLVD